MFGHTADNQDYRAENLVVENVGHTLQKRTFRKGERRNKRREEGRANTARTSPCDALKGADDSVPRRRGGVAEIASSSIDVAITGTEDERDMAASRGL
jgi:hypothetical protein